MGSIDWKKYEELESDFNKILSKGEWKTEDFCKMKDIQKILYYIDAREGMKNGQGFPGSEYLDGGEGDMSFRRGRNPMNGRYISRDAGRNMNGMNNGSGTYYPPYMDGMNMSGRRYYDSEREKALHKLHHMMDNTDDPERKSALNFAIKTVEEHNMSV